jgi:hypothetical protein
MTAHHRCSRTCTAQEFTSQRTQTYSPDSTRIWLVVGSMILAPLRNIACLRKLHIDSTQTHSRQKRHRYCLWLGYPLHSELRSSQHRSHCSRRR